MDTYLVFRSQYLTFFLGASCVLPQRRQDAEENVTKKGPSLRLRVSAVEKRDDIGPHSPSRLDIAIKVPFSKNRRGTRFPTRQVIS